MQERSTDQAPGDVQSLPEVPETPAPLFEPMSPPVVEPALTTSSVPPTTTTPPPARSGRMWPKFVGIGAVAALLGLALGYAVAMPGKSDMQSQRDAAQEQVTTLQADLTTAQAAAADASSKADAAQAKVDSLTADNTTLTADNAALAAQVDVCSAAAVTGNDLAAQWANLFSDLNAYYETPYGSSAEAELYQHIMDQTQKMDEQQATLVQQMVECGA